jgi:sugar lactone lactonase YvrE
MSRTGRLGSVLLVASLAIIAAVALSAGAVFVHALAQAPGSKPNPYQTLENYFKLPDGRTIGSTPGIDIDRDGSSVWVFERCGASACPGSSLAPLIKFDPSGKVVKTLGAGMFIYPHGLYVDRDGNVWVSDGRAATPEEIQKFPDTRGKGHTVFKLSPEGKILMTLGKPGVAGDTPDTFNQPTDIIAAPNGDIFVSDGHGGDSNARIVKFTKDGKFIKTWGKKGSGPGEFDTPHGLAFDSRGRLFVADRGNNRIQIFDQDGTFLDVWRQFGRPSGISIDKSDTLYATDSQSNEKINPGFRPGIYIGSAKDGKVATFILDATSPIASREGIAVDAKGNIYGSLTSGMALKKYVKGRIGSSQ